MFYLHVSLLGSAYTLRKQRPMPPLPVAAIQLKSDAYAWSELFIQLMKWKVCIYGSRIGVYRLRRNSPLHGLDTLTIPRLDRTPSHQNAYAFTRQVLCPGIIFEHLSSRWRGSREKLALQLGG